MFGLCKGGKRALGRLAAVAAVALGLSGPALGQSYFVKDSFVDTANVTLESHVPSGTGATTSVTWAKHTSYTTGSVAASGVNTMRQNSASTAGYVASATAPGTDYTVSADVVIKTLVNDSPGIALHMSTGENSMYFVRANVNSSTVDITRMNAGTSAAVWSQAKTWTAGTTVNLSASIATVGSNVTISVFVDGVQIGTTYTDVAPGSKFTSAGSVGLRWNSSGIAGTNTTGIHLANFAAYTITPATAVTLTGPSAGLNGSASSDFTAALSPVGGSTAGTVTVTPSDGGNGGTFTPASVVLSTATQSATFTYTPASTGTKTISIANNGGLTNPSSVSYVSANAATSYTFTGPTSGTTGTPSTNFTVALPAGTLSASSVTVTPSDGGNGGTFTPSTATLPANSVAASATFTYTPASTGAKTLSVTNNGGLTNPANITYTSASGPATGYTFSGPTGGLSGVASTNFTVSVVPTGGTVTGTVTITPSDAANGGTFTPASVALSTATQSATFTYTPASSGTKTLSVTNNGGFTNPANIDYSSVAVATSYTLTGPTSGTVNVLSSNFTVALPVGTGLASSVTVTPSDGGNGGTFTPASVALTTGSPSATFQYTAASTGAKTISTTDNGGLTDPASLTYTASQPLPTAPLLSYIGTPGNGTAAMTILSAGSGGTAPLTHRWHRSTTPNFTPDGTTAIGSNISGTPTSPFTDTGLTNKTTYYYRLVVTDATAAASASNLVAVTPMPSIVIGFVGDSISQPGGYQVTKMYEDYLVDDLRAMGLNIVGTSVKGVGGANTGNWTSTSPGTYMANALTAFAAAGVTHVNVLLGANDSAESGQTTPAQYQTNMTTILNTLVGAGYKVLVHYPFYIPAGAGSAGNHTELGVWRLANYGPAVDAAVAAVNSPNCKVGVTTFYKYFTSTWATATQDGVHPNDLGCRIMGASLAEAWNRVYLNPSAPTGGTVAGTKRKVQ